MTKINYLLSTIPQNKNKQLIQIKKTKIQSKLYQQNPIITYTPKTIFSSFIK